jgi:hypothetical protein
LAFSPSSTHAAIEPRQGGISNQLQIAALSHYRPAVGQNDGILKRVDQGTQKLFLK